MSGVHEARIATRWTDFDPLGHLTHSIVFDYFDEARDQVLRELVGDFETWPYVVAHVEADFRLEVGHGPRELVVRTSIVRVGESSVRFRQELLTPEDEVAVESEVVLVAFDPTGRQARPIADGDRARLLTLYPRAGRTRPRTSPSSTSPARPRSTTSSPSSRKRSPP